MRHGVLPYRDLWDHKGLPVYFLAYLASFFGPLYIQFGRILTFAFPLTGCLAFLRAIGQMSRRLYLFSGCLGAAVLAALGQGMMTEQLEAGAILWALAFLIAIDSENDESKRRPSFLAGLCIGTAVIIRLPALILLPVVALALIVRKPRRQLLSPVLFLAGAALPVGLTAVFLALTGLFDDMLAVYVQGSLAYARASQISLVQFGRLLLYQIAPNILAVNALYLLLGLPGLWQLGERMGSRFWPFLFLLMAATEALITRYGFFSHYWSVLFWLLVPGTAYILWHWQQQPAKRPQQGWSLSLGLLFLLAALPAAQPLAARLQPEYRSVASELSQYVRPGDYLWVGGTTGGRLYLYTNMRPAAPYFYTEAAAEFALDAQVVVEGLREKRPLIVIGPNWHKDGRLNEEVPAALGHYLTENYHLQAISQDEATGDDYLILVPN